jgi:hypothetical protein
MNLNQKVIAFLSALLLLYCCGAVGQTFYGSLWEL